MNILILGGGISGLTAAWYARKQFPGAKVILFEKSHRVGGWIETSREGGFLFERGPRTFQTARCPHLLALIREAGLEGEIIQSSPAARRRFLWCGGRLRSTASFFPQLLLAFLREPFVSKGTLEDESIYDFAARRLGAIANTLIDALAIGIFAGDIRKLSVRSCFPFLSKWEQEKGSLLIGALCAKRKKEKGLFTLKEGMETLIRTLAETIDVRFETPVEEIREDGVVASGRFYPAYRIVSALSGSAIGNITGLWTDFQEADLAIAHLAYEGDLLPRKGFGYLVPTQEKENLLGMVWDSAIFPCQGKPNETRVTAMLRWGGVEEAKSAMERHLGVSAQPIYSFAHFAERAIPQFHVGYAKRLAQFEEEIEKQFPRLTLVGNYLRGASVEACVSLAKSKIIGNSSTRSSVLG